MQMIQLAQKDISVYMCRFQLHLLSANISIKFPCHYFVEWKSLNGKLLLTSQKYPSSASNSVQFNQVLELTTEMLYDNKEKLFYKKETLLAINLVSKSRPDQVKLVGRVNVDLALIANNTVSIYSQFAPYKLTYCSVNADATLKVQMGGKQLTNKLPNNLDKSSFNDFFMINSANSASPEFGLKPSPKFSNSNSQNTFSSLKVKELKESRSGNLQLRREEWKERETQDRERGSKHNIIAENEKQFEVNDQSRTMARNYSTIQINKKDDTSFRTIPHRRQSNIKSAGMGMGMGMSNNQSMDQQDIPLTPNNNTWRFRQKQQQNNNNFSQEIDLNKRKIADLERKIGDLCRNLEESKTVNMRREIDNRQKEELIQKLAENQERMREQFQALKRMKMSSSSNQVIPVLQVEEVQIPSINPLKSGKELLSMKRSGYEHSRAGYDQPQTQQHVSKNIFQQSRNGFEQLYNQKISQALQTQRIIQENQYIIRELQATRSQLQKKLSVQKNQTQQLQSIWKEKRQHFEEKIRSLEKQKRQGQYEMEQLVKYKYKVQQAIEDKNKMKLQYKELEHELMKTRFQLNQKILKNSQYAQKLHSKEGEIQKLKGQIKQLNIEKGNTQKQVTESLIANEKLHSINHLKQQELAKLQGKLSESERVISQLRQQLVEIRKQIEEKQKVEDKLLQYNTHMDTLQLTIQKLETELQGSQYLVKANQTLSLEIAKLQKELNVKDQQLLLKDQEISEKLTQITNKQGEINELNLCISKISEQKHSLIQKNTSFNEQLQHIQSLLQQSFHKASKQSSEQILKLQNQLQTSNQHYEQLVQLKAQQEEQFLTIIGQKQERINQLQKELLNIEEKIMALTNTLEDKQNIITLKDTELQNRKSITQQLTLKLQAMQAKQSQMRQTIAVLQVQSKNIFTIIQEKQLMDEQILHLRENTQQHLEIIKELQDVILQMKLQKQDLVRKYYEEIDKINQQIGANSNQVEKEDTLLRKKLQQAQGEIQQLSNKLYAMNEELQAKQRYTNSMQSKNQELLKKLIYLQSIQQSYAPPRIHPYELSQLQDPENNTLIAHQSIAIREREMQLRLEQQKNLQKFVNEISELSQKIIQLEAIINDKNNGKLIYDEGEIETKCYVNRGHDNTQRGYETERMSKYTYSDSRGNNNGFGMTIMSNYQNLNIKKTGSSNLVEEIEENQRSWEDNRQQNTQQKQNSKELTPIKNRLDDQLALQSADYNKQDFILSDRKKPVSNRSNQSNTSFQYVHTHINHENQKQKAKDIDTDKNMENDREKEKESQQPSVVFEYSNELRQSPTTSSIMKQVNTHIIKPQSPSKINQHQIITTHKQSTISQKPKEINTNIKSPTELDYSRGIELNHSRGTKYNSNVKQNPQLKISELTSLVQVKNLIIKDLQNKCIDLTIELREKQKLLKDKTQPKFTGKIRQNSAKRNNDNQVNNQQKIMTYGAVTSFQPVTHTQFEQKAAQFEQKAFNKGNRSRSRSRSPSNRSRSGSKIANNYEQNEKEFKRMKNNVQSQQQQIRRLKKNLKLMNLELCTLRHLKKEQILGNTQIRINRSFSHMKTTSVNSSPNSNQTNIETYTPSNLMMDTHYFNLSNAVNPLEKSYIIKKIQNNQQEELYDMRRSPKKPSAYDHILERREQIQHKFNITSRLNKALHFKGIQGKSLGIASRVLADKTPLNKENSQQGSLEQRIIQKLQNTAHFSNINMNGMNGANNGNAQQNGHTQFTTTINQLKQRVNDLQQTLGVLQEEKQFLESQLEMFEQEKFCLSSDLNAREIQIYELYKSILALREELRELKYQNQSYLKVISEHENNLNSIVRKQSEVNEVTKHHNKEGLNENKKTQKHNNNQSDNTPERETEKMVSISVSGIEFRSDQNPHLSQQEREYESMMRQQREQERFWLLQKIEKYQKKVEESLLGEKEKQILQEQIQSKQEIMIDQNQKLYLQESIINELNSKVQYLEREIAKLQEFILTSSKGDNPNATSNPHFNGHNQNHSNVSILQNSHNNHYNSNQHLHANQRPTDNTQHKPNYSIILHQNEALIRQNMNLKEETIYLGNQIDRINAEFINLNNLLYKRQDEITQVKYECAQTLNKYQREIDSYQKVVQALEKQLESMVIQPDHPYNAQYNHENYIRTMDFLQGRMTDLKQEFNNLKLNLINIIEHNQLQELNESNKEFLLVLIESMENTIGTSFNLVAEINAEIIASKRTIEQPDMDMQPDMQKNREQEEYQLADQENIQLSEQENIQINQF